VIHQVHLSDVTRRRLTDVVMLQLRLLRYAALTATPDAASCARYLDRCARFRGRGTQIAAWLWRAPTRHRSLEAFAQGPGTEKLQWYMRISHESLTFLRYPIGALFPHIARNATSWQRAGATFLQNFYDDLCIRLGLPGYIFSGSDAATFRRQELLREFVNANTHLHVCAACDESGSYTIVDNSIRAGIEHYLSKSHYPHLACHPFNLLPICPLCNSFVKQEADPLGGRSARRRNLEDVCLPYREVGLGSRTYLQVRFGKAPTPTQLGPLRAREATDLRQRIAAFGAVYKIPQRWQGKVNTVGENLFRRIRQFLRNGWHIPTDETMSHTLLTALDHLLCDLCENQGKEPFAFAMTWWLATLINQKVEPATHDPSHPMPQLSILLQALFIDTSAQSGAGIPTSSAQLATARILRGFLQ